MNNPEIAAGLAHSMDSSQPLTFIRHHGSDDVYARGEPPARVMIVIPGLWTSMSPELLTTMRARRTCTVNGRCPICDACATLTTSTVKHEASCPVTDDRLKPQVRLWSQQVGQYARGRRIQEDPTVWTKP